MKLIELLGSQLKSEAVLSVLEEHDMEIIYHVDRLFENEPDSYSSNANKFGFEFSFNAQQVLVTIFCHAVASDGIEPIDCSLVGVPFYSTIPEAKIDAQRLEVETIQGGPVESFGRTVEWVKLDWLDHSRHYEFEAGELTQVTLMVQAPR